MDPFTSAGLVLGGGGILASLMGGGSSGPTYDRAMLAKRESDINDFAALLDQARSEYLNSVQNFQTNTFNQYMPLAEAQFAGRGLNVTGGAYQTALARESANRMAELTPLAYSAKREDLNKVQSLRSALFGASFDASNDEMAYNTKRKDTQNDQMWNGLGQLGGALLFSRLNSSNYLSPSGYSSGVTSNMPSYTLPRYSSPRPLSVKTMFQDEFGTSQPNRLNLVY